MSLTPEQKALRLQGIGGSEIGGLFGLSPFTSPITIFRAKCEGWEIEDGPHLEWGRTYERPTGELFARRRGYRLTEPGTVRSKKHRLCICTPDFLAWEAELPVLDCSIKCPRNIAEYGDDGTDQAPAYAILQLQWELIVLEELHGITRGEIVAPIFGDLRCYPFEADRELQGQMLDAAARFWRDHIEPRRPPPPDASDHYADWLASKFPASRGEMLRADGTGEALADNYRNARKDREEAERREKLARNELIALIGDADGIEGDNWKITYRNNKGRACVNWAAVADEAAVPTDLIEKHTTRKPFRTFRPVFPGENNE